MVLILWPQACYSLISICFLKIIISIKTNISNITCHHFFYLVHILCIFNVGLNVATNLCFIEINISMSYAIVHSKLSLQQNA